MHDKILNFPKIKAISTQLKRQGKQLVAVAGSFDVLHIGHVEYLQAARSKGDALLILLNSDRSIRLYKGPGRPINKQRERAAFLSALSCVDYVVIFDDINPLKYIVVIKPEIYCKGADWGGGFLESETVAGYGGTPMIIPLTPDRSTTKLVKKLMIQPEMKLAIFYSATLAPAKAPKVYELIRGISTMQNLLQTASRKKLNLSKSWIVSDREEDIVMGRMANLLTIKIGASMERVLQPLYYAKNSTQAFSHIK